MDLTALQTGQIVVWISSRTSSYSYSPAVAASFAADFPQANLVERKIPPEDFVKVVTSKSPDEPAPDVAFIDNYRELQPLLESKVVLSAWGTSRFPTHGWWVIFKDTQQLVKAKAFIRWVNRAPRWQPSAATRALSPKASETVQKAAIAAFHALMSGDQAALDVLLDRDAARSGSEATDPSARFTDIEPVLTFGNNRIAFVLLSAVGSSQTFYGMRQMIFIFRNQGDGWRILQMDPNAMVPFVNEMRETVLPPPLLTFDSLVVTDRAGAPPPSAVLVDPVDRAVLPRWPERPDITWRSDASTDSTFIVESQFTSPRDEVNWSASRLTFSRRVTSGPPFRQRAPFGVGMQPHRWRIWTLVPSGAVSVSAWRTILFSN